MVLPDSCASRRGFITWAMVKALPAIASRKEIVERAKDGGEKIAAVLPVHYPRGLLRACGFLPIEVWGPPRRDTTLGDGHLQAYTCSVVRSGLSFLLQGKLDVVDAVLVPHTCDSLQGLASVLIDFIKPAQPVLTQYYPRNEGPSALPFFAAELRKVGEGLSAVSERHPSDEELHAAIDGEEAADAALAELYQRRTRLNLSAMDFYKLVRSREYLPAEVFEPLARGVLAEVGGEACVEGVPVLLSGMMPEPMSVLDVLEEAGAAIVADDLACGSRRLYPAAKNADPYLRMAQRLLGAVADPTRGSSVKARADHVVTMAKAAGVQVAIFYEVKFCEPEQFYLPLTKKALAQAGVRSVVVEVDICEELPGQVITRLEAILEAAS